jgi:UDP-N-acetyl-D-galactosamine dehydrogenase
VPELHTAATDIETGTETAAEAVATRRIAIIGLGYVGLPLAVAFGRTRPVLGFDIDARRIADLRAGRDGTCEVSPEEMTAATGLRLTSDPADLTDCDTYIVTVPTPIDAHKRPDLTPLMRASETIGAALAPGDLVIYESTVYPGATEEDCVPVLERVSGLTGNRDFHVGYSPERINPGDRTHRLPDIRKVTSGGTPEAADLVDALYAGIITAGTFRAAGIRTAEAAKVIENTQRDLNIALINELAMIFNRMGLDTQAVLEAAGTKWNFLPFRPGLVGGHCIGVDPYYLTHKAEAIGYRPEIILAGRRINDGMGAYVAGQMIKAMLRRHLPVGGARVLLLGLAFKENCPDLRNTRVVDVIAELQEYGVTVDVHDPLVDPAQTRAEYGVDLVAEPCPGTYDGVILCVAHDAFRRLGAEGIRAYGRPGHVLYDLKHLLAAQEADLRL